MFREFNEKNILRFREFDEARGYIENFSEESLDAIDYMIVHKEFYFLLKNVLSQLPDERIVDYIFLNLPCLKREEDLEFLLHLIDKYEVVKDYIKSCQNVEFAKRLYEFGKKVEAIEIFKSMPEVKDWLKEKIKDEDVEVKKAAIEFFELYDPEFAKRLKEEVGD